MTCIQGNITDSFLFSSSIFLLFLPVDRYHTKSRQTFSRIYHSGLEFFFLPYCYYQRDKGRNVIVMPAQIYGSAKKAPFYPCENPALVILDDGGGVYHFLARDGSACPATIRPDWKQHPLGVRHTSLLNGRILLTWLCLSASYPPMCWGVGNIQCGTFYHGV